MSAQSSSTASAECIFSKTLAISLLLSVTHHRGEYLKAEVSDLLVSGVKISI